MARTLPLRCFPAGLKAAAVMACPPETSPIRQAQSRRTYGQPLAGNAPGAEEAWEPSAGEPHNAGLLQGQLPAAPARWGRVCRHTHRRPPALHHTKRRPSSISLSALGPGHPSPFSAGNLFSPYLLRSKAKMSCCVPAPPTQPSKQTA